MHRQTTQFVFFQIKKNSREKGHHKKRIFCKFFFLLCSFFFFHCSDEVSIFIFLIFFYLLFNNHFFDLHALKLLWVILYNTTSILSSFWESVSYLHRMLKLLYTHVVKKEPTVWEKCWVYGSNVFICLRFLLLFTFLFNKFIWISNLILIVFNCTEWTTHLVYVM